MSWLHAARQRLRDMLAPESSDRDLREEMAHHLDMETARQVREGAEPAAARWRALARLGDPDLIAAAARAERGAQPWEGVTQDLQWALRGLRKNAGFTTLALCTLTLGIGATAAAFTVLDTVLLRPLPYRDTDRLVLMRERTAKEALLPPSYPNFVSWRQSAHAFDAVVSATYPTTVNVWPSPTDADGLRVPGLGVSHGFFAALGVMPVVGREFSVDETTPGGRSAVMVSYEFWQEHMGGRTPLGTLRANREATPVVGVLPPNFRFRDPADIYYAHERFPGTQRNAHNYLVVGHLRPGVTLAGAHAEMSTLSRALLAAFGNETQAVDVDLVPLRDYLVSDYRVVLFVVFGAAALVLLIACTNLVSAQLARGRVRERDVVVRVALGASRTRIVRQLMLESVVLVAGGTVLALLFAAGVTRSVRTVGDRLLPRLNELSLDLRVVAFTASVALLTAAIVGLYPAVRLANRDAGLALRGTRSSPGVHASVWRLLVGFQVALAVVLLTGSALLVQTFHNILTADTGFDSRDVLTVALTRDSANAALDQVLNEMRGIAGVRGAAWTSRLPLSWGSMSAPVRRPGDPGDHDWPAMAGFRVISPEYFSVLRQPVLRGRPFTTGDRDGEMPVAVITPGIATALWPGQDPIGKQISTNFLFDKWLMVVGVVAEASSWTMPRGTQNEVYVPIAQHPGSLEGSVVAVVRTEGKPESLIPAVRGLLNDRMPGTPALYGTIAARIATSAADRRFAMLALVAFGAIALVLAAVGIYGVIWYIVTTRTHEIGIRMALGATGSMVRSAFLRDAATMALSGIVVGVVAGAVATRYLQSTLYGVSRLDPRVYALGGAIAFATALLAAYAPARRSSRVDPMIAIRGE